MRRPSGERGFLLIAVLVVVMLASMVALSLIFRLRAEQASFVAGAGAEQAWYAANSGIQQAMHIVKVAGQDYAMWENNPAGFRHQLVVDDGSDRWYFTIFSPPADSETDLRYGLVDENRKLNLNKASADMLQKVSWLSAAQIREITGNESALSNVLSGDLLSAMTSRPQFSTMDELLRLAGFTPGVIYGEDANHNFRLDPNEDDGRLQFPPDDSDGQLFLGLQEVATVFTYQYDIASDGSPRFQLNSTGRTVPEFIIPEKTAAYIAAAWKNNRVFKTPADLLEAKDKFKDESGREMEMDSGVGPKELPIILDQLTTVFEPRLVGLININTASIKVLQALPGITEAKAEAIFQAREGLRPELRGSPAWLYQEGLVTADEFKKLAPHITANSFQYRFNVVGYAIPSGRYRVFEVVIDIADKQPQVSYLRDITRYGLPFQLPSESDNLNVQTQPQT